MELIDLVPNSLSFRVITTIDVDDEREIPTGFTGRVRRHAEGFVAYVAWYSDGLLHNPSGLHPAYRRFRPDGRLKYELHYRRGLLHDPNAKTAAVRGFYANGQLHYEERYREGQRTDGPDGSPAIRKWRLDGTLRHEIRYRDGTRIRADGRPMAEVDGNRTRRTGIARPNRFEGGGAHQVP